MDDRYVSKLVFNGHNFAYFQYQDFSTLCSGLGFLRILMSDPQIIESKLILCSIKNKFVLVQNVMVDQVSHEYYIIYVQDCQYPADRVPLRTRCALTRAHVSITSGYASRHGQLGCRHTSRGASPRLLARGSSGATTCPMAPTPESRLGAAWVLPRDTWR
jgi:hypothetical protein